jgi:predicted dehydrogenase
VEVGAFIETSAKQNTDVDDTAVCVLKTENGIVGTLAASWSYKREDNSTIIYAEKAVLRLEDDPTHSLVVQYATGETVRYELGKIQSNESGGQTGSYVIDHFVTSIIEDTEVLVDGNEGKNSLMVILGALESNESKKIVNIKNELN